MRPETAVFGVAPYVGAWIETDTAPLNDFETLSHPTWVRGLKLLTAKVEDIESVSHPTWVRGLKPAIVFATLIAAVAPYVGAWIETQSHDSRPRCLPSHPTWVRGLKRYRQYRFVGSYCRTLRGCVD